jgi:hypothetical protein
MILIALTGQARSGKNTVGKLLASYARKNKLTIAERGFTDMMKLSLAKSFTDSSSWIEAFKLYGKVTLDVWGDGTQTYELTGRQMLQRYGTEAHRDVFGKNFWIDMLLPEDWEQNFGNKQIALITDLRFESEAARVKELGGEIWRVMRPGLETSDDHATEQPISDDWIDATLINDSDLENLYEQVADMMDRHV